MEGRRLELGNDGQKKWMEEEEITRSTGKGIMLFGVRVMEAAAAAAAGGCFRKSASMTNLAHYPHHQADSNADVVAGGYASDDVVHPSARSRERKRGVPWSEEEHKLFLMGLQKVGKGDWRGISRNFVKTRTPTQVASHAQKYFLRLNNHNRRRRRSSLFDITTHTFKDSLMEDHHDFHQKTPSRSPLHPLHQKNKGCPVSVFPVNGENSIENLTLGQSNLIRTVPSVAVPPSSKMADLNLNHTASTEPMPNLSLEISAPSPSSSSDQQSPAAARHGTGFQGTSASFNSSGGDSIISVA